MRILKYELIFISIITLIISGCRSKSSKDKFALFNQDFFAEYVPEFPGARLLTKHDIPSSQQQFFDESNSNLQLLFDMNNNNIPEYIICGVSDSLRQQGALRAYFIAMFEQTDVGFKRHYIQQLRIAPVNIKPSENKKRPGVIVIFEYFSEFGAEIYFENEEYHLERWY